MGVATGTIVGYVAEKISDGWHLRLILHPALPQPADGKVYLVDFRSDMPRVFSRADSVLENASAIGFDISQVTSVGLVAKAKAKAKPSKTPAPKE